MEIINLVNSLNTFGMNSQGCLRMRKLCALLGEPQNKLRVIHVAGTNGKGSVTAILANGLKQEGFKVGAYTSPALTSFVERIQVNGNYAKIDELNKYHKKLSSAIEKLKDDPLGEPTEFEVVTALAFMYFIDKKVDIVILEVGLGGKFDATNVIDKPLVSVITSISKDHTSILGDTLEEIAAEKAGIIKKCSPVVLGDLDKRAYTTINNIASGIGAPIFIEKKSDIEFLKMESESQVIKIDKRYETKFSLLGSHQLENLKTALQVIEVLKQQGIKIDNKKFYDSISKIKLSGRFEIINYKDKKVIFDVAHNEGSYSVFLKNLTKMFNNRKTAIILGIYADKDIEKIATMLSNSSFKIITTTPVNKRAMPAEALTDLLTKHGVEVIQTIDNPKYALREALELDYEIICVTGSFSTVGPAKLTL
ncbi:folylpolyglutamate synthase/dihydrofolate synthase family protein [Proteinivorax tanatarense]|uniref:tetrahydrofolate synthase n=1 Tax=Proteinivorax tanatarense TaxID=1260629 RepID=A0AAU7VIF9_9FIRM